MYQHGFIALFFAKRAAEVQYRGYSNLRIIETSPNAARDALYSPDYAGRLFKCYLENFCGTSFLHLRARRH